MGPESFEWESPAGVFKTYINHSGEVMNKRHRIQFPKTELFDSDQDESYFYLHGASKKRKIKFHDYDEIYQVPGLYEQIFYDRLKCTSPSKVTSILESSIKQSQDNFTELRVLDLGAGNGMMGRNSKSMAYHDW